MQALKARREAVEEEDKDMSDLKPSDVEAIVKDLEAVAMARATIPADATPLQKYTALFAPIAGDDQLNRSQAQWYLGACVANVAGEFQKGSDPG